jgi:hypothetical protein
MKTSFSKIYKYVNNLSAQWASHPDMFDIRERQLRFLKENGWTDKEFDQYLLWMIDSGWEGNPVIPTWLNLN